MIDKRLWSGVLALVTLIVAGAGALPELLLRSASTAPTVVVPMAAPKAGPVLKPVLEVPTAAAPPRPIASNLDMPKPEPVPPAVPVPAPPVSFPPVQLVGVAAASAQDAVAPANPPAAELNAAAANAQKPPKPGRLARPEKPKKSIRPAVYPIGEFLAWRR